MIVTFPGNAKQRDQQIVAWEAFGWELIGLLKYRNLWSLTFECVGR